MTAGCITNFLTPESVTCDTRLILGNALYFKGICYEKFDPSHTKNNIFHSIDGYPIEAPFMISSKKQFISVYDEFKVLKLSYKKGQDWRQFSYYIFLPNKSEEIFNLSKKLSYEPEFLDRHIPVTKVPVRNFRIPKFKISVEIKLSEILQNQGLALPFAMTGDFSEMVDSSEVSQCYVLEIVHKCYVEVNEEGSEAAAASAAVMIPVSVPSIQIPPIDFVADHAFLFLIREDTTGVVIFSGQLLNPFLSEKEFNSSANSILNFLVNRTFCGAFGIEKRKKIG